MPTTPEPSSNPYSSWENSWDKVYQEILARRNNPDNMVPMKTVSDADKLFGMLKSGSLPVSMRFLVESLNSGPPKVFADRWVDLHRRGLVAAAETAMIRLQGHRVEQFVFNVMDKFSLETVASYKPSSILDDEKFAGLKLGDWALVTPTWCLLLCAMCHNMQNVQLRPTQGSVVAGDSHYRPFQRIPFSAALDFMVPWNYAPENLPLMAQLVSLCKSCNSYRCEECDLPPNLEAITPGALKAFKNSKRCSQCEKLGLLAFEAPAPTLGQIQMFRGKMVKLD